MIWLKRYPIWSIHLDAILIGFKHIWKEWYLHFPLLKIIIMLGRVDLFWNQLLHKLIFWKLQALVTDIQFTRRKKKKLHSVIEFNLELEKQKYNDNFHWWVLVLTLQQRENATQNLRWKRAVLFPVAQSVPRASTLSQTRTLLWTMFIALLKSRVMAFAG